MNAAHKVVTGFNHNVQHRGQPYHVQTEDSGLEKAQIVTHLFLGGNILSSKRTSYAELRSAPNLRELVRALMEEQHKEMLRDLVSGVFDQPQAGAGAPKAPPPPPPVRDESAPPRPEPTPLPLAREPSPPPRQAPRKAPVTDRSLDQVILRYLAGENDED